MYNNFLGINKKNRLFFGIRRDGLYNDHLLILIFIGTNSNDKII